MFDGSIPEMAKGEVMGGYNAEYHRAWSRTPSGRESKRRRAYKYRRTAKGKAQLKRQKVRRLKICRGLIFDAKNIPCQDCGGRFPPFCMDLHHVNGDKKFYLSKPVERSITSVRKEIAKCVALCAVCHRLRHWMDDSIEGELRFVAYV